MNAVSSRVIAACFALSAFAVAIISGLASDNPVGMILGRALIAMFVCYPVGLMVGVVCERAIIDHVRAHREENPAPDSVSRANGDAAESDSGEPAIVV